MADEVNVLMAQSLHDKLAAIVEYQDDLRLGKRGKDTIALNNLLDDPEVASWITAQKRKGIPRRFVGANNGGW